MSPSNDLRIFELGGVRGRLGYDPPDGRLPAKWVHFCFSFAVKLITHSDEVNRVFDLGRAGGCLLFALHPQPTNPK